MSINKPIKIINNEIKQITRAMIITIENCLAYCLARDLNFKSIIICIINCSFSCFTSNDNNVFNDDHSIDNTITGDDNSWRRRKVL